MPSSPLYFITALLLIPVLSQAQLINDCASAVVVCTSDDQAFNPDGPGLNDFEDPDNDPGCIPGLETNSAWYYFQIGSTCPPGLELGFIIHPDGGYGVDYDWALFGPNVECGNLGSPLRCSGASADCQFCPETGMGMGATDFTEGPGFGDGFTALITVQPGEGYYLLVNNWLPTNTGFVLEWTEPAAPYLDCNVTPPCALYALAGADIVVCEGDSPLALNGGSTGSNGNETYTWTGTNGGTSFLSDPNSQYPLVNVPPGFTGEITYTLTVEEGSCMNMDSLVFTVTPLTVIDITPVGPLCENSPIQTLTATPAGGTWSGDNNGDTFDPMAHGPGTYTVSYYADGPNECPNTESITIEVYESPTVGIDPDPAEFCAEENSILLTADGDQGSGPYTYDWITPSGTGTGSSYSATESGIHQVIVTDDNGCSNTAETIVTIHPTPVITITDPGPLCLTTTSVFLVAAPSGGTFSGSIISPAGEIQPINNPPGTYPVTYQYTDANGCQGMAAIDIMIISAPDAFADNNSPICEGLPVELYGTTSSNGPGITYFWTGPNGYNSYTQNPADATSEGLYTLVVEIDGCTSAPAMTTVVLSAIPDAEAFNGGPYCSGQTIQLNGSTTSTANNISFAWTGPNGYFSDLQNPTDAIEPGTYQMVVDADGCLSEPATTQVIVYPTVQPVITGQASFCTGFSSTLDAGPGYIAYLWDDASVNQTREVFTSGTYTVTVTDINGCSGEASFITTETPSLTPSITGALEFCQGSATTLDAGAGYANYTWSTGETSQFIQVTTSGTYTVSVADQNGCPGSTMVNTVEHPLPVVVIGGSTTYCIGGSTVLDAGAGYSSYTWNNSAVTQSITVSAPGMYSVDVIDNFGCAGSASVNVNESTSLHPVITGNTAFCENGSTTLNAGSGFATYLWSDGSTNQNLVVSAPGTYAVTVTDGVSCSGDSSVTVNEIPPPVATLLPAAQLCNTTAGGSVINLYDLVLSGDLNGTWLDADQSGATGPFTNLDFNNLAPGNYHFTYTTNSAVAPCPEAIYDVIVTVEDCVCPEVMFFNTAPLCNSTGILDLSSIENTAEPGTWTLIMTPPGNQPASLNGVIFNASGGDPGQYTVQFSLLNPPPPGCPIEYQLSIDVDQAVEAGMAIQPVSYCANDPKLVSLATLITGADPNGAWTEMSTVPSQGPAFDPVNATFNTNGQMPGTYTFRYTLQANGACQGDATDVSVIIHPSPTITVIDQQVLDCNNPVQSLDASGSSSGPEYDINWSGPGIIADGNEHTLHPTIDQQGNYILSIINTLTGCLATDTVRVKANTDAPGNALLESKSPSCDGDEDGFILINAVIGGTPPYQSSLNGAPYSNTNNYTNLSPGDYSLVIKDTNGCRWDTLISIESPAAFNIELGPDIELGLGEQTTVNASVNLPSDQIDTIIWSPADAIACIDVTCLEANVLASKTITLTATVYDQYGCSDSDQVRITVSKDRKLFIPNAFSPNDDGINDVFFVSGDADQIVRIRKLAVYSRWGEAIFLATDIKPNDPAFGWDGRFDDQLMNPNVYLYSVEVEYIDGVIEKYTGDVTLLK